MSLKDTRLLLSSGYLQKLLAREGECPLLQNINFVHLMVMNRENNCDNCIENKMSVFNVLTKSEKDVLRKNYTCQEYRKGEIIFKEGDKPSGLICLSEGKVKVFKEGVGGREQIVRMAKPVGFIGYRALFAEENHTATAVAIEDCVACIVEKESVYRVIRNNADLSMSIIRSFAS